MSLIIDGKMTITSSGNLGIGTTMPNLTIKSYNEWEEIHKLAETNSAVKSALDKLKTVYYLSRDHGSKT